MINNKKVEIFCFFINASTTKKNKETTKKMTQMVTKTLTTGWAQFVGCLAMIVATLLAWQLSGQRYAAAPLFIISVITIWPAALGALKAWEAEMDASPKEILVR